MDILISLLVSIPGTIILTIYAYIMNEGSAKHESK